MEIAYNSSKPFEFVLAFPKAEEAAARKLQRISYDPYYNPPWVFFSLVFQNLKNVRFLFPTTPKILSHLERVIGFDRARNLAKNEYRMKGFSIRYGIIDSMVAFLGINELWPRWAHVSPIIVKSGYVIMSSVRSDAKRESSETLSFQGLSTLVWVLVGFLLLVVSGLVTYFTFETEKKKNSREKPLVTWMKSAFVFAADIVNNCVAGVVRAGPGRLVRSWWLLGVVFLMQFWSAGMKSELVLDRTVFVDTLDDLLAKPGVLCQMSRYSGSPFVMQEEDPRYDKYIKVKRYVDDVRAEKASAHLANGSGVVLIIEKNAYMPNYKLFDKLKQTNRKLYVGKKVYDEGFSRAVFNKRLPRVIKEDLDYLISRISETRLLDRKLILDKFKSRHFIFDPDANSAVMSWSGKSFEFMSPVFRMWAIGTSLATVAFCVEFYLLRRRPVKVSHHHSLGIPIRAE